jgi:hypothetical protein
MLENERVEHYVSALENDKQKWLMGRLVPKHVFPICFVKFMINGEYNQTIHDSFVATIKTCLASLSLDVTSVDNRDTFAFACSPIDVFFTDVSKTSDVSSFANKFGQYSVVSLRADTHESFKRSEAGPSPLYMMIIVRLIQKGYVWSGFSTMILETHDMPCAVHPVWLEVDKIIQSNLIKPF